MGLPTEYFSAKRYRQKTPEILLSHLPYVAQPENVHIKCHTFQDADIQIISAMTADPTVQHVTLATVWSPSSVSSNGEESPPAANLSVGGIARDNSTSGETEQVDPANAFLQEHVAPLDPTVSTALALLESSFPNNTREQNIDLLQTES